MGVGRLLNKYLLSIWDLRLIRRSDLETLRQREKALKRSLQAVKQDVARLKEVCRQGKAVEVTFDSASTLAIETIDGFEVAYRRGTKDEEVLREIFSYDVYYSRLTEYEPAEDDVIIDVGAHIGTFSLLTSSKVRRCKVYAVEACQDTFNVLRINVALNGLSNISTHHLAITDKEGPVTLYHDTGNWGHTVTKVMTAFSETVESTTLSRFLEMNHIETCQFMKLNCEGAEFPILLSTSPEVLRRFGTILILYHCELWAANTPGDLLSHLRSAGFRCVIRHQKGPHGWIIATNTSSASKAPKNSDQPPLSGPV
jgi:FkbM family methyltransferase